MSSKDLFTDTYILDIKTLNRFKPDLGRQIKYMLE